MADKKISALTAASTPLAGAEVLPIVQSGATVKVSISDLTAGRTVLASSLGIGGAATSYAITSYGAITSTTGANYFAGTLGVGATPVSKLDVVAAGGAASILRAGQSGVSNGFTISSTGSSLTYQINDGNLVVGTAAQGVNFTANTPAAGMTSQLLNWYEEGTWTPVLEAESGAFGAITYNSLNGGRYVRVGKVVHIQALLYTDSVNVGTASLEVRIGGLPFAAAASSGGTQNGFASLAVSQSSDWVTNQPTAALVRSNSQQIGLFYRTAANGASSVMTVSEVTTGSTGNLLRIAGTYIAA